MTDVGTDEHAVALCLARNMKRSDAWNGEAIIKLLEPSNEGKSFRMTFYDGKEYRISVRALSKGN